MKIYNFKAPEEITDDVIQEMVDYLKDCCVQAANVAKIIQQEKEND